MSFFQIITNMIQQSANSSDSIKIWDADLGIDPTYIKVETKIIIKKGKMYTKFKDIYQL